MTETNFSLLSQEEIDTLVAFLTEKSNTVDSEVLSQESIDKLISAMRSLGRKAAGNQSVLEEVRAKSTVLGETVSWVLDFQETSEGFMEIFATDGTSKEKITPKGYACSCFVGDDSSWGYAVSPIQFVDIAKTYHLQFSKEVYESVCRRFAERNYGDANYDVNEYFLGTGKDMLACLL